MTASCTFSISTLFETRVFLMYFKAEDATFEIDRLFALYKNIPMY